jgi:AcrR family transcriptional regulator
VLNRLLDAAESLVAEKGLDAVNVVEMARRAGASVGGFYRRFRDKEALIHAVHERFCEEARATADAALDADRWAGASAAEILSEFADFLVHIYRERAGFFRAFITRGFSDDRIRERTAALFRHIADRLLALLRGREGELTHPQPEIAVPFALRVVLGTLNHTIQMTPDSVELSDDRLTEELTRVLLTYLGVRPALLPTPNPSDGGPIR